MQEITKGNTPLTKHPSPFTIAHNLPTKTNPHTSRLLSKARLPHGMFSNNPMSCGVSYLN